MADLTNENAFHNRLLAQKYNEYWNLAEESGLSHELLSLPLICEDNFQIRRRKNMRAYAYMNRITNQLLNYMEDSQIAAGLFDNEGCLLKLYGNEQVLSTMCSQGIAKQTLWKFEDTGPNAVTMGLAESKITVTVGNENYCNLLKPYAVYFSPIVFRDSYPPYSLIHNGGVALFLPEASHRADYLLTCFLISNTVLLQLHSQNLFYNHYESLGYALLTFDINVLTDKIFIFYQSNNLFDMLNIPPSDITIRSADEFIDPLPENADFWSVIRNRKKVSDFHIMLKIQGKAIHCIITTEPYGQPGLNVKGINIVITTSKQQSAQVSEKMGNSAIRTFSDMIGQSAKMKAVYQKGRLLANTDSNVMLLGESGVGKDILAQAIHNASRRASKPFIAVNCGALPRDLIASELFGYDGGAFTGAKRQGNIGKFELANNGTIFLDEIAELPMDLQATLLRVVEQKQFMRIGGNKLIDIDVKIISATNANIPELIEYKKFRSDLYYRLSTMHLFIPPLRERGQDIILLSESFITLISQRLGLSEVKTLSNDAKNLLMSLPWRGNVRELQNLMESIIQLYPDPIIKPEHIMDNLSIEERQVNVEPAYRTRVKPVKRALLTEADILEALDKCNGNRSDAAYYLGIARKTLYRNMERLGMQLERN